MILTPGLASCGLRGFSLSVPLRNAEESKGGVLGNIGKWFRGSKKKEDEQTAEATVSQVTAEDAAVGVVGTGPFMKEIREAKPEEPRLD